MKLYYHPLSTYSQKVLIALYEKGIDFTGVAEDTWVTRLLGWLLPVSIFLLVWMFLLRRMAQGSGLGTGMLSVGKSTTFPSFSWSFR